MGIQFRTLNARKASCGAGHRLRQIARYTERLSGSLLKTNPPLLFQQNVMDLVLGGGLTHRGRRS